MLLAIGLLLRLGGSAGSWVPPLWLLTVLLLILPVIEWATDRSEAHPTRNWHAWASAVRNNQFGAVLLLLAAAGTAVRVLSLAFDLGQTPIDIDETRLAVSVLEFFRTGETPHDTVEHYPGILYWLLAGSSLFTYLGSLLTGAAGSLAEVPFETFVHSGRLTNTLLAAGITILTGLIGRALRGPATGLLAAGIVAFVPLSVGVSTELRNEAALLLFVTAAVWAATELTRTRDHRWALAAGALAGAATAIKYSGVFALLPVLLAAAIPTRTSVSRVPLALLGFVATLATTNHFLWADFPNFVRQLAVEVSMTGAGHWAATDNPAQFYLTTLSGTGPGLGLVALSAGFVVYACAAGRLVHWVVLLFPLVYMWFMTQQPSQFPRWVYPLVPFVAVAGSSALVATLACLRSNATGLPRGQRVAIQVTVGVLAIAVLWGPTRMAATEVSRRSTPATHDNAHAWLRQHTRPGDRVLAEYRWLDLSDLDLEMHRVPNLAESLEGGEHSLWAHDWVVVPEVYFGHPGLERLRLAQSFLADRGFGGNRGFDFMIYTAPYRILGPVEVDFGTTESAAFLGPGWVGDDAPEPGMTIPRGGASIFVPALEHSRVAVQITFLSQGVTTQAPTLRVEVDDEPVLLIEEPNTAEIRMMSGTIARAPTGVTEVRIAATEDAPVRIVRLSIG